MKIWWNHSHNIHSNKFERFWGTQVERRSSFYVQRNRDPISPFPALCMRDLTEVHLSVPKRQWPRQAEYSQTYQALSSSHSEPATLPFSRVSSNRKPLAPTVVPFAAGCAR